MTTLTRASGELRLEGVALSEIARRFGTPCYVYSRAAIEAAYREFDASLAGVEHLVCYAMKANSNLAVLDVLRRLGAGFDIVSGGELARVLAVGGEASKVLFSGVGKSEAEIDTALSHGIRCFNVESDQELERLDAIAGRRGVKAPVSLRVNPDVDAGTHPYISTGMAGNKFGIPHARAIEVYRKAAKLPNLRVTGIDCHIGSQILETAPLEEALDRVLGLVDALAHEGIALEHLDLGGGIGIRYRDEAPPDIHAYGRRLVERVRGRNLELLLEPGRAIVGNAGVLLTKVEYLKLDKARHFAVVDASMSELIRPALYDAWHEIVEAGDTGGRPRETYDVVGPVCESSDVLGRDRALAVRPGDLLAILSAGAYAMAMSSNYNTRPRPCEVMIDGETAHEVRAREPISALFSAERTLPR
ncbi:diaminopimelate decarboxylase [Usitatibacter palustris]|uniref:Diaminopimelate decarboxylase n=1 Tax=Usitatibacter palustris TaxID=2732487 RepID=A0A6M4HC95_9PROT|nr:diaminopimelate decarboxylase [Usitatibacter palustris]QJR16862.1 Diaminopimelate decarboxylase [Usitatibacter palustris]